MGPEKYKEEVDKMVAKILELEEEEYTIHKDKSWSVNGEEIAALGLSLAKIIHNHKEDSGFSGKCSHGKIFACEKCNAEFFKTGE